MLDQLKDWKIFSTAFIVADKFFEICKVNKILILGNQSKNIKQKQVMLLWLCYL